MISGYVQMMVDVFQREWLPAVEEAFQYLEERKSKVGQLPRKMSGDIGRSVPSRGGGGGSRAQEVSKARAGEGEGDRVEGQDGPCPAPLVSHSSSEGEAKAEPVPTPSEVAMAEDVCQPCTPAGDWSYFFQSSDGQYIFLHPLNMRCLMAEAEGQFQRLPCHVHGKVLEVETISLTAEVRGRYSFMKHLPLYCSVMLVELDLKPFLSEATYGQFKQEIKKRQQRRKNKGRSEARSKKGAGGGGMSRSEFEDRVHEMRARQGSIDLTGNIKWTKHGQDGRW